MQSRIRIGICCRSRLFSEGLQALLSDDPAFDVIGSVTTPSEYGTMLRADPDLVLSDMDTLNGWHESGLLVHQKKILAIESPGGRPLSGSRTVDLVAAGVVGILPHAASTALLRKAIRAVCAGELWINQKILRDLLFEEHRKKTRAMTKQESTIGRFICRGLRNKEIARELNISEQTVKSHCNRLYRKLGVSDRLQLALLLIQEDIPTPG